MILKFDSLGRQKYLKIIFLINLIRFFFFYKFLLNPIKSLRLQHRQQYVILPQKNDFDKAPFTNFLIRLLPLNYLSIGKLAKYSNFCSNIFQLNNNILFIDIDNNFNYLPCNNKLILNKSPQRLYQFLKYFNVNTIVFMNLKKKNSLLQKLLSYKLINISVNNSIRGIDIDLQLELPNTPLMNYIIYIHTLHIYLKFKF